MHLLVKFRSYGYRNLDFVTKSLIFCVFRKFTLFLTSIGDILDFWKAGILEKGGWPRKGGMIPLTNYGGNQFLIPADWIIENDLPQILSVVLEFFDLSKFSRREWTGWILTGPKLAKWISTLNCPKSAKWNYKQNETVWNYISPVTEKLETSNLDSR